MAKQQITLTVESETVIFRLMQNDLNQTTGIETSLYRQVDPAIPNRKLITATVTTRDFRGNKPAKITVSIVRPYNFDPITNAPGGYDNARSEAVFSPVSTEVGRSLSVSYLTALQTAVKDSFTHVSQYSE